jgi:hypothetical protein
MFGGSRQCRNFWTPLMSWVGRTAVKSIQWVRSIPITLCSTADICIDYYFSYSTDVVQNASFEDDGDVRKLSVKISAM